ncbi:MAG: hypothetical protein ACFB0G_13330 [Leptolyngbyaceae cyanobacterium]
MAPIRVQMGRISQKAYISNISGFNLVDFFNSARSFSPHLTIQNLSSQLLFIERPKTPQLLADLI